MKVLWVINSITSEIATEANRKAGFGGGWIPAMSERLRYFEDVNLHIVVFGNITSYHTVKKNNVEYHIFPKIRGLFKNGGGKKALNIWEDIINYVTPDIIHVYGTEQPSCIELVRNFPQIPIIVSLQGIITEYHKHYYGNMQFGDIFRYITLADMCLGSSGYFGRRKFATKIPFESEILQKVRYVEGRTTWDKAVSLNINPHLKYFDCKRVLRKEFYDTRKWDISQIERHTLFTHQGNYAIKGLHMLIDALAIVKRQYPDVILYVAGQDPSKTKTLKGKLSVNGYSLFIKHKLKKLGLQKHIQYVGPMGAQKVADELSKVHISIVPSAIENSPNSLAEAMIIGTPCIASYVGGNADMLNDGLAGKLYAYNDSVMLANAIIEFFRSDEVTEEFSSISRTIATQRHDPDNIVKRIYEIYSFILNDDKRTKQHEE